MCADSGALGGWSGAWSESESFLCAFAGRGGQFWRWDAGWGWRGWVVRPAKMDANVCPRWHGPVKVPGRAPPPNLEILEEEEDDYYEDSHDGSLLVFLS